MLPSLAALPVGRPLPVGAPLTTEQCVKGLLHRVEPFLLETLHSLVQPNAEVLERLEFVEKHKRDLEVVVSTVEVENKDVLRVEVFVGSDLASALLYMLGPFLTGINEKDSSFLGNLKTWALNAATFAADLVIGGVRLFVFKDGKMRIAVQITDMWQRESLRAELIADGSQILNATVEFINMAYKGVFWLRNRNNKDAKFEKMDIKMVNDMFTKFVARKMYD